MKKESAMKTKSESTDPDPPIFEFAVQISSFTLQSWLQALLTIFPCAYVLGQPQVASQTLVRMLQTILP